MKFKFCELLVQVQSVCIYAVYCMYGVYVCYALVLLYTYEALLKDLHVAHCILFPIENEKMYLYPYMYFYLVIFNTWR